MYCELEHDNKLMQMPYPPPQENDSMEVYQWKTNDFKLLTNLHNKRGKYLLCTDMLKENNAYSKNTGFGDQRLKRQLKS